MRAASVIECPATLALIIVRSRTLVSSSTRGHRRSKQAAESPAQRCARRQAVSLQSRQVLKTVQSLR